MRKLRRGLVDILGSEHAKALFAFVIVLLTVFVFFLAIASVPHLVGWYFWCAPNVTGLSLSQDFLILYVVILNWLAIEFFVVPGWRTPNPWSRQIMHFAVVGLVAVMTYNLYYWHTMPECRAEREPELRQLLAETWGPRFARPQGLRPFVCGEYNQRHCWVPVQQASTYMALDSLKSKPSRLREPDAKTSYLSRLEIARASDEKLLQGLQACLDDIHMAFYSRSEKMVAGPDFDFFFLREDPWGRALVFANILPGGRTRGFDMPGGRLGTMELTPGPGPSGTAFTCYFDGATYSRFDEWNDTVSDEQFDRDRAELERLRYLERAKPRSD